MLESFDLNGRVAVITGGAGLLGKEHALALLELGATVYLADIQRSKLDELSCLLSNDYPGRIYSLMLDVTNETSINDAIKTLDKDKNTASIIINNAAINPKANNLMAGDEKIPSSRLEILTLDTWHQELEVGLTGALLVSRAFGKALIKRSLPGVIVNIASDLSVIAPDQRLYRIEGIEENKQPVKPVTYSVIKAGLIGLTRYIATYWANEGIRCNAISPGGIYDGQSKDFLNRINSRIPMGRMANKNEYRSTLQYLCSDASAYMTGQNIVVDGGRTIW